MVTISTPGGNPGRSAANFAFERLDGRLRVGARAHQHDAAGHLTLAVEFSDTAAHLRPHLDARHIADPYRHAGSLVISDLADVVEGTQVAGRAHHVLGFTEFKHRTANFLIGRAQRVDHFLVGHAVSAQAIRIEHDLVLTHHAAETRDLGDVWHGLQLEAQEPVLKRAQLRQIHPAAAIDERVLIYPTHAGRVRAERAARPSGRRS